MSVTAQLPQDGITQGSTVTSSQAIAPDENPAPIAPVIRKDSNPEEAEEVSVSHPQLDSIVNTPPAPLGEIAFAARLTPAENTSNPDPSLSKARVQAAQSQAAEPISTQVSTNEKAIEQVSKLEAAVGVTPEFGQSQSAPPARAEAPPAIPTPTAHMEQAIEPTPAATSGSSHDITVRIPDTTERGMDVRFVERGGEVRVSVRTGDSELAQTLRGGLNEFVSKLGHGGIQAEVWRPDSDTAGSQNDPRNQQWDSKNDQRGSGSERNQAGSQGQKDGQKDTKKPRWVEELETSIGSQKRSPDS